METDRFELFVGLNNAAMKSIQRMKTRKMKEYGLSSAHTNCICRLETAGPDGLTQMELVHQEMMDASQISRVLRELMDRELVKADGSEGKYRRRYSLTEKGMDIASDLRSTIREILSFVSQEIPMENLETFYQTFREICDNLARAEEAFLQDDA